VMATNDEVRLVTAFAVAGFFVGLVAMFVIFTVFAGHSHECVRGDQRTFFEYQVKEMKLRVELQELEKQLDTEPRLF